MTYTNEDLNLMISSAEETKRSLIATTDKMVELAKEVLKYRNNEPLEDSLEEHTEHIYQKGYDKGYDEGYDEGYDKCYEDGAANHYD